MRNNLNLFLFTNRVSTNITYGAKERSLRQTLNTTPNSTYLNFTNPTTAAHNSVYSSYIGNLAENANSDMVSHYLTNRIFFDTPYAPITSSHPATAALNFDSSKNSAIAEFPMLLQGKEDLSPAFVFSTY